MASWASGHGGVLAMQAMGDPVTPLHPPQEGGHRDIL